MCICQRSIDADGKRYRETVNGSLLTMIVLSLEPRHLSTSVPFGLISFYSTGTGMS